MNLQESSKVNWNQEVEDLGPRLFRYFGMRFSDQDSDDLTQETLIRLVRKVEEHKFDPLKGNLAMLAFGIAHFVALESQRFDILRTADALQDHWENQSNDPSQENLQDPFNLLEYLQSQAEIQQLRSAILKLAPIEQQVLSLMVDQELSLLEISVVLEIPEGTVKSHIHRCKAKLLRIFEQEASL